MKTPLKISVVIPAYNGEQFIAETLDSVLNQSHKPDQLAVIIDESHDKTEEIVRGYSEKIEIYHNSPATGFVDAWNRAIGKAKYPWICLLHQDDLLHPQFLEKAVLALEANPDFRYIYGPCNYIDEKSRVVKEPNLQVLPKEEWTRKKGEEYAFSYLVDKIHRCPGVLAHQEVFTRFPFRKEPGLVADNDFFLRVASAFDVLQLNFCVASFRHSASSATHSYRNLDWSMFTEYSWMLDDYEKSGVIEKLPFIDEVFFQYIVKHGFRGLIQDCRINGFGENYKTKVQELRRFGKNNIHRFRQYKTSTLQRIFFAVRFPNVCLAWLTKLILCVSRLK